MDPSYVGAYWGSRRESALECGQRLSRCLADLGSIDPALAAWFRRGASRAAAKTPVGLGPVDLGGLFEQGRNRRDADGEVIEELGFRVGLWNRARPAVGMSVHGGSYSTNPGILNSFVLNIPALDDGAETLYQAEHATAIFEAVVQAWEPEWATWATYEWREAQSPAPREPVIGWLTYLGGRGVEFLPFDVGAPFASGVCVRSASRFTDVDDAVVRTVRRRLQGVSALHPIP